MDSLWKIADPYFFLVRVTPLSGIVPPFLNQRTIGPVSLTWVLRMCWIKTNLEIQEHSILYKLSPIQKHQEQIWPCHKNGQGQSRVIIWRKPQRIGVQLLGKSSGSILKLYSHHFAPVPERSLLPHYFIWYFFYFIHVYKALGQEETTRGDNFLMQAERSYHIDHLLHVSKLALPSDFMHIFSLFYYMYIALGQGQTDH